MKYRIRKSIAISLVFVCWVKVAAQEKYPFKENAYFDLYSARNAEGKFGYVDEDETTKLPFIYDFAGSFGRRVMGQPGWATVAVNGKYGIIDLKGKYVVPPNYDYASEINNGYFMVQKDSKWGVFNELSKLVIPLEYDYIYPQVSLVKTVAAVKNKKWGVLKTDNSILVPFEYDLIAPDYYGYGDYNAYKDGGSMKINPDGKIVKKGAEEANKGEEEFKYNSDFKYKITSLNNVGVGLKTKSGEVLLPNEYDGISECKDNLPYYEVSKDDKVGLYKADSKEWILAIKYDGLFMASENIICAETYVDDEKSTYQYLDLKGKPLFNEVYDEASYFNFTSQNFAVVKKGEYYGVIDQKGKPILPFDLLKKPDFNLQNFLVIQKATGFGVLSSDLKTIVPALYAQTTLSGDFKQTNPFADWRNEDYFIVLDNKSITHGILKKDGTFALPLGKYSLSLMWADRKKKMKHYFAEVRADNGKYGLWDVNQKKIAVPIEYENLGRFNEYEYSISTKRKGNRNWGLYLLKDQKEFYSEDYTYYEFNENDKIFIGEKYAQYSFSGVSGKYGLVDKNGSKITTMDYENITWMKDGYYAATKNDRVGVMDAKGSWIVPMEYDVFNFYNASGQKTQINPSFYNDHFYLPKGKANILFDLNAKKITDTRTFEEPETSYLRYEKTAGFDFIESSNSFYREPKPITKKWLLNKKIYSRAGGSYNYKGESLQGKERYWVFNEGLIVAMRDGKYGYLDFKGNEVIPFEFDEATSFELTGVASVKKDNKWFTIDRFGRKLEFPTVTTTILKLKK